MDLDSEIQDINIGLDSHLDKIRSKFAEKKIYDLKRYLIYEKFKEIIYLELEKLTKTSVKETVYDKLEYLIKQGNNLENKMIPESKNKLERNILEIKLDVIRYFTEIYVDYSDKEGIISDDTIDFEYYPEYTDPNFNLKIYSKQEFHKNKIPLITPKLIKNQGTHGFEKSPTQKFVKNFISEHTPYNGILLWHDVGVGKTCAGISIAENFRDSVYLNDKKILILTPSDTLQQNWRDEIINIEKEINKVINKNVKNVQCTGSRYTNELVNIDVEKPEKSRRNVNKIINKYYEFFGYQKLARQIMNRLEKNLDFGPMKKFVNKSTINYIRQNFSNRVIVMDEVHVTRDSGTSKDKLAKPYIELIARYAENTKMVLLTATPMYNLSREMIWLLNILLLNDKKSPIEESDIFEKDGEQLKSYESDRYYGETAKKILIKKSRGYISYLKGENPFTFPIKLYPTDKYVYTPTPKKDKKDNAILSDDLIKNMKFYKNQMSEWQYKHVLRYTKSVADEESGILESDVSNSFAQKPTAASNIVFPSSVLDSNGEFIGQISEKGFKECFIEDNGKYTLSDHVKNINDTGENFLHINHLKNYSSKFHNILSSLKTCKGIGFVYSQFISAGVLSFALALEANGFTRYVGNGKDENLLSIPSKDRFCAVNLKYESQLSAEEMKTFSPAKYILLTAQHTSVNNRNQLVKECRGTIENPNTNGENIKIVLGTRVVEQGISFRRIREIHIMDPWHHLNQMHQAVGRGFRYKSHMELDEKERNVTVYLHIGALPLGNKTGIETSDEYIYRRAYAKKLNMAEIEYILKKNAIDCELNKMGNAFLETSYKNAGLDSLITDKVIIDSKLNKRVINVADTDYSDKCNFKECDYKCYPEDVDYDTISINSDTYNDFFAEDDIELIKEYIKTIFDRDWVFNEKEILDSVNDVLTLSISEKYIYTALTQIIENREIVYDGYGRKGYIINRNEFYIFQPYEYKDENMPILYRYLHNYNKIARVSLENEFTKTIVEKEKEKPKVKVKEITQSVSTDIDFNKIQKILRVAYNEAKEFIFDKSEGQDAKGYFDYPLERSADGKIPSKMDLTKCLFLSYIEKFPETHNIADPQTFILRYVVTNIINSTKLSDIDKTIVDIIMEYYDTPLTNSYIIRNSDIDPKGNSDIIGFRLFNKSYKLYLSDSLKPASLVKMDMQEFKQLKFVKDDIPDNTNLLYGFVENKKGATRFNIVNKGDGVFQETFNRGTKRKNKKTDRTGAVCGQALGAKDQQDLYKIINSLLGYDKHYKAQTQVGSKYQWVYYPTKRNKNISERLNETDFSAKDFKATLCQEIELILRYKELTDNKVNKTYRHFYKLEEILAYNSFRE
mgnify:CR=1 FL=1|tara:strand:- start:574 stop:4647 length:4074 start_codon:yes stop_codon:yes gene_type:complete